MQIGSGIDDNWANRILVHVEARIGFLWNMELGSMMESRPFDGEMALGCLCAKKGEKG